MKVNYTELGKRIKRLCEEKNISGKVGQDP